MPARSIRFVPSFRAKDSALRQCLIEAGQRYGCTEFSAGLIFSHVLEAIAEKLADGEEVVVPGFGRFGHYLKRPRKPGRCPYAQPTFDASKPLNNMIKRQTIPCEQMIERRRAYRKNHAAYARNTQAWSADPKSALASDRNRLRAEAEHLGYRTDQLD